jgi:hypothetical protein
MQKWSEILQYIEKNPVMYLGTHSIFNFESFWYGYCYATYPAEALWNQDDEEFDKFLKWIPQRHGVSSSQSWARIVFFYSGDERHALTRLFDLFREYKEFQKTFQTSP